MTELLVSNKCEIITGNQLIDHVAMTTRVSISSQQLSHAGACGEVVSEMNDPRRDVMELRNVVVHVQHVDRDRHG